MIVASLSELLLMFFDSLPHFRQILDHAVGAAAAMDFDCRSAGDGLAVRYIIDNARLCGDGDIIADGDMADNADLSAENAVMAQRCRACDADLRDKQAMRADLCAVADGNLVAYFCAFADDGIAERAAFDGAAGAKLDIIFKDHHADLRYFMMLAVVGGEAEAILADGGIGVDDDAIADLAAVVNNGIGIDDAVVADGNIFADKYAGIDFAVIADFRVIGDDGKIINIAVIADAGRVGDGSPLADADFLMLAMAVQKYDDLHKGIVRVFGDKLRDGGIRRPA